MATFSAYINPSSAYQLVFECIVKSQSIANNTSTVQFVGTINRINSVYGAYNTTSSNTVNFGDGYEYPTTGYDLMNGYSTQIFNFEKTLKHDAYGKWSKWVQWDFSGNISGYNPYGPVGATLTLPTIPRASEIYCSSPYIGDPVMITIDKKVESFTSTVTYKLGTLTGTIANKTSEKVFFFDTERKKSDIYALMPNSKQISGTMTCTTYNGNTQIGDPKTATFTLYAKEEECKPDVSGTVVDTNPDTIALTGDSSKLIKHISKPKITIVATPKNSATIKSYSINLNDGQTSTSQETTFASIGSNSISINAADSRGYSNPQTLTVDMIDYVKLHIDNIDISRTEEVSNEVVLNANGVWFNSEFTDGVANSLVASFQYKISGDTTWTDGGTLTPTIDGNTFVFSDVSLGNIYDFNNEYQFKIVLSDSLLTVGSGSKDAITLTKGIAVVEIGDELVNVNGTLTVLDKSILDLTYPVGSIYISVNNVNPSTFFGGTWERWGTGRMPVGIHFNSTEFNEVEKIGGSKTHTLTIDEMPSHSHDVYLTGSTSPTGTGRLQWTTGNYQEFGGSVAARGGGQPHNNLPPYIVCCMWKRTA